MSFECFGIGATAEDTTTLGYNQPWYTIDKGDNGFQGIRKKAAGDGGSGRAAVRRHPSKLELLVSAEQCVFDLYCNICMRQCKLGIDETQWRRLLKRAGVLDYIGPSVATNVHYRSLLPGGMRRLRLEGFQKAIAMIANYCYPLHHNKEGEDNSKTLVDTYNHFVVKHLLPLVGTWRIGKGGGGGGRGSNNILPPNFDECDLAADLMKEWRDTRGGGHATFVTSFDPASERVKLMRNRSHSPKRTGVILVKKGNGGVLERRWIGDEDRRLKQHPIDVDDTNTTEVPRKAVAPIAFSGTALIAAAAKLKKKSRQQKKVNEVKLVPKELESSSSSSGMTKDKAREFYKWLKELYEYTIAFEEWIKDLSPINDAYDYIDRACGLPSGKITINKLQSAARTSKFTDSPHAVNMLFYFLDIHGLGYITRSAFKQWRNARDKTMESYMILFDEGRQQQQQQQRWE